MTVANKTVLITGAARGIGAGTARELHRRGANLILTDLDAEPLAALAAELGPERALTIKADVCDLEQMQDAVAAGIAKFGGVDLVLANAGIASYGSIGAVDPKLFKRVLDVNILGVFHTVRAALPSVIARRGYILVVSSEAAFTPAAGLGAYTASKAAVENLASALRAEVAHHGVDVGSAHMSWIDTPMVQDVKKDLKAFHKMLSQLPGPLAKTSSLEVCVQAFVAGLEQRKRRVWVPRWVQLLAVLKPLLTSPLAEREMLKRAAEIVDEMDREVEEMGRSASERVMALDT